MDERWDGHDFYNMWNITEMANIEQIIQNIGEINLVSKKIEVMTPACAVSIVISLLEFFLFTKYS